jgi:hypothetical protein
MIMNTTTLTVGDSAPDFSGIAVGAEFAEGKPFRLRHQILLSSEAAAGRTPALRYAYSVTARKYRA